LGKKGGNRRLKRMKAPAFWPIPRKEATWTAKPSPGPHNSSRCLTLLIVVRDILGLARTYKEVKLLLSEEKILVDGKPRRDFKFPVGIMDVIEMPATESFYRVLPNKKGLILHPVDEEEAAFKVCRIEDKRTLKNGLFQLNLHDGRNVVAVDEETEDQPFPVADLNTYDVLKMALPEQEIIDYHSIDEASYAIVTGGKNIGRHGKITSIDRNQGLQPRIVTLQDLEGVVFQTVLDYVFALGDEESWVSLPEVA